MSDSDKNQANLERQKKANDNIGILIGLIVGAIVISVIGAYAFTYFYGDKEIAKNKEGDNFTLREPLIEGGMFNIGE